ncbi:MAG: 50S ribosomal protein L4 [Candidatus Nealsonbacteria bacterium]|nr:50S ribosomal protein L4 [Candidatus Nealsonbacteria bacterium]
MKIVVYNTEGKEVGSTLLPKEIFGVKMNSDLVHQVAISQSSNLRQGSAHAKDRSEVSGGGKKPWRQKGTGRARVGSNRSPIWKGGGVTFGPRNAKDYKKEIPKKMRRQALFMVLSQKLKENLIIVLDELKFEKAKTKVMAIILKSLPVKGTLLLALPNYDKNLILSVRNIPKVLTIEARNLNVLDLLNSKCLIMSKDTIKTLKETFIEKESSFAKASPSAKAMEDKTEDK